MGIGLAVVARYVKNMNGQIRVRSELGKGTIFGIELPFEHATGEDDGETIRSPSGIERTIVKDRSNSVISLGNPESLGDLNTLQNTNSPEPEDLLKDLKDIKTPKPSANTIASPDHSTSIKSATLSPLNIHSASQPSSGSFTLSDMKPTTSGTTDLRQEYLTVLIAEDNPINAKLLTKRLKNLGHAVELSNDGQECHDFFTGRPGGVDVILMDLQVSFTHIQFFLPIRFYLRHFIVGHPSCHVGNGRRKQDIRRNLSKILQEANSTKRCHL